MRKALLFPLLAVLLILASAIPPAHAGSTWVCWDFALCKGANWNTCFDHVYVYGKDLGFKCECAINHPDVTTKKWVVDSGWRSGFGCKGFCLGSAQYAQAKAEIESSQWQYMKASFTDFYSEKPSHVTYKPFKNLLPQCSSKMWLLHPNYHPFGEDGMLVPDPNRPKPKPAPGWGRYSFH